MKRLLELLNEMQRRGLISSYALGGATALIYYFEPIQTQDIDVFVVLESEKNKLVNLAPIFSFLEENNISTDKEYVIVDGIPVQILVPYNELVEDAVKNASDVDFRGVNVRIPSLEHLMAIMVQTGRGKDKVRLEELCQSTLFDQSKFEALIDQYQLKDRWEKIKQWLSKS